MRVLEIEKEITRLEAIRLEKQAYLNLCAIDIVPEEDEREWVEISESREAITCLKLENTRLEAEGRRPKKFMESASNATFLKLEEERHRLLAESRNPSQKSLKVSLSKVVKIGKKLIG